jgi:hypothetical protein
LFSALTLGIIPVTLPVGCAFDYDLDTDGIVQRYSHELSLRMRVSIWEWLVIQDERQVLAAALAKSQPTLRPPDRPDGGNPESPAAHAESESR